MGSDLGSTVVLIVMLLLVCLAAYVTIKFLGNRGRGLAKCKYMQVKDSIYVARDKTIAIVEAGGRFYMVGVANQSIQLLGTIEKDELVPITLDEKNVSVKRSASKLMQLVKNFASAPEELKKARAAQGAAREHQSAQEMELEQGIHLSPPAFEQEEEPLATPTQNGFPQFSGKQSVTDSKKERTAPHKPSLKTQAKKTGAKAAGKSNAQKAVTAKAQEPRQQRAKENKDEIDRMMQSIQARKARFGKKDDGDDSRR